MPFPIYPSRQPPPAPLVSGILCSSRIPAVSPRKCRENGSTLHLFFALSAAVMRLWFHRFAIGEHKVTTSQRRVTGRVEEDGAGCISPRSSRTNRDTFLSHPCTNAEYTTPYFGTGASRFTFRMHVLRYAAGVPCDEGGWEGDANAGERRGGSAESFRRGRRTGISRMEFQLLPFHAAFKLYFSPKITFGQYSISRSAIARGSARKNHQE